VDEDGQGDAGDEGGGEDAGGDEADAALGVAEGGADAVGIAEAL